MVRSGKKRNFGEEAEWWLGELIFVWGNVGRWRMGMAWKWAGMWVVCAAQMLAVSAGAASCAAVKEPPAGAAETAYLAADYEKAAGLYRDALAAAPGDEQARAALVRVLLREQKVADAAQAVAEGLAKDPGSAVLLTARAEVELREGEPWVAALTAAAAFRIDPCEARTHLVVGRLSRLNSQYKTARDEFAVAHALAPWDTEIHADWIRSLPEREQVVELERGLAEDKTINVEDRSRVQASVDAIRRRLDDPQKACRLISTTSIANILWDPLVYHALDVKLNHFVSKLQIDTGASGILISRSVADHAKLKPFAKTSIYGVGDEANPDSYSAYVDSIQIGGLEFRDCTVEVINDKSLQRWDGLIGMDVFSKFLITLDYHKKRVKLDPLPPLPGEDSASSVAAMEMGNDLSGADIATNRYMAPEMKDYSPIYREGHDLLVPVALNHTKGNYIVDFTRKYF